LTEQDARTGAYVRCIKVDHSNPLGLEEIEEEEFTINAFSVNQGAGKGKWFIGYNNNDGNKTGRIVKDDNTAATITTVERINADPETYMIRSGTRAVAFWMPSSPSAASVMLYREGPMQKRMYSRISALSSMRSSSSCSRPLEAVACALGAVFEEV